MKNLKFTLLYLISFLLLFTCLVSNASDFISPNSGGEPIIIDVSNLNLTSGIDVTVAGLGGQPRPYRDNNTRSLVIFPSAVTSAEQTIEIKAGNSSITKTVSFRSGPQGDLKSSALPSLEKARAGNTATKISDGRVVLIGGSKGLADSAINSLEVFDPEKGKSEKLTTVNGLNDSKLKIVRSQHTATYIGISESPIGMISGPVEQILIVGGFSANSSIESSIEILEIKVGTNQSVSTLLGGKKSKLKKARIFHTANLLPDGRVIIIGGQGQISMTALGALNSIEIFDPVTKTVVSSGIALSTARLLHSATILQSGDILISGGFTNDKPSSFGFGMATETCELINTGNLSVKNVSPLVNNEGIGGHSAVLLSNGLVFISGGSSDFFSGINSDEEKGLTKNTLQFYNPITESFSLVSDKSSGNIALQTSRFLHSSVLLPNGNVAVIGGSNIKKINSTSLINTPVSLIEVFDFDLLSFSGSVLKAEQKPTLDTFNGRILPTAILVTPKNKTKGFFSTSDTNNFVNSGIFLTGGFTNGSGRLPSKSSEFIQVFNNSGIEGRQIKISPDAVTQGGSIGQLLIELDNFAKVPSLTVNPQTVNLSSSNDFMTSIKVLSTNNQVALLKAEASSSIVVSPSLFQVGETVSISRKDSSAEGEFEISFSPVDSSIFFIPAKVKVNISSSSKPFLSTVPANGLSLSNEGDASSDTIQLKVFSQDGSSELSSIPSNTQVTATVLDPTVVNLGGAGISSVIGNLSTQFMVLGTKPGKTSINFSINFPDVLNVSVPVEVSGTPSFSSSPVSFDTLSNLVLNGVGVSKVTKVNNTSISLEDVRLTPGGSIFPFYIPVNLLSSVDGSDTIGSVTLRPVYGVDLFTATPRALVNPLSTGFRSFTEEPTAIAGFVSSDDSDLPISFLGLSDGLKSLVYEKDVSKPLNQAFTKLNGITGITDLKSFEFNTPTNKKIVALKDSMISIISNDTGIADTTASLSSKGFELELTKISNQDAAVVSVGNRGIDLVFALTDQEPRVVNFQLPGNTQHVSVVNKLSDVVGPFAISYDGSSIISIVNLVNLDEEIKTIDTNGEKILKINYAGRFNVNGKLTDVLLAQGERKLFLYDLNNRTSIPTVEKLTIKNKIEDSVVIDGIAYLALGTSGVSAVSIGSLLDDSSTKSELANFTENRLIVIKANGAQEVLTKPINVTKLADSSPFLLCSGPENPLTVIRVVP